MRKALPLIPINGSSITQRKTVRYVLDCLHVTMLYRLARSEGRKLVTRIVAGLGIGIRAVFTTATMRLTKLHDENIRSNSAYNIARVYTNTKRKLAVRR